jgi:multiple sugar transport system permease protein
MKSQRRFTRALAYIGLAIMLVCALFPIYWILVTSFKATAEIYRLTPSFWPEQFVIDGYTNLMSRTKFVSWLRNSAIIALVVAAFSLVLSVFAAYGLARFRFQGRRLVGFMILVAYLMPPALLFIPLYIFVTRLGLAGSTAGLLVVYPTITIPYATWVLTSYFRSIPIDMEEAAQIDGCSRLGALWHVTLPLSAPGIVSTFIFAFTLCWSEYLYALVILSGEAQTIPLGLSSLIVADVPRWNEIMAGAMITSIPVTIMYIAASRYIVSGLTLGGSKG